MNVIVSVDGEEAARDRRRVALPRGVDLNRFRRRRGFGDRRLYARRLARGLDAAMERDLPAVDAPLPVGHAGVRPQMRAQRRKDGGKSGMAVEQYPRAHFAFG